MGRSAIFAASAAVLLCAAGAQAGLLVNPFLETGADQDSADGWTLLEPNVDDTGSPVDTASFQGFANHEVGGARGLWFRSFEGGNGPGSPATVSATLYQDLPGTPGQTYTLSAWFKEEANFIGQNSLFIEFLGAGDSLISSAVLDVDAVQINDSTWRQFMVNGVAPMGTVTVRVGANMFDGMFSTTPGAQSTFVDDFELSAIPAPAGVVVAGVGLTGLAARRRR
ncbi:MAG: hypothetical protein KDA30_11360 [Phycisphaerales bacterium]|nr:hypothetical protein [Phycisphaerales bacterium]MCA9306064.1 hypothetical protein [Phycisphaerales bacterium]